MDMYKREQDNRRDAQRHYPEPGVPDWAWGVTYGIIIAAVLLSLIALLALLLR